MSELDMEIKVVFLFLLTELDCVLSLISIFLLSKGMVFYSNVFLAHQQQGYDPATDVADVTDQSDTLVPTELSQNLLYVVMLFYTIGMNIYDFGDHPDFPKTLL